MFGVFRAERLGDGCAAVVLVGCFTSERRAQIALGRHLLARHWQSWSWTTPSQHIRRIILEHVRRDLRAFTIAPLPENAFLSTDHPAYTEVL